MQYKYSHSCIPQSQSTAVPGKTLPTRKLNDDRKSKEKESYRASAVIYVHLQVNKLGGSTQKIIRKLCQVVVGEPPGGAETKQQCETVYSLTKTRLV